MGEGGRYGSDLEQSGCENDSEKQTRTITRQYETSRCPQPGDKGTKSSMNCLLPASNQTNGTQDTTAQRVRALPSRRV